MVAHEINVRAPGAIAIVGAAPTHEDVRAGKPFASAGGRLLEDCMAEAGMTRTRVNLLNVCREKAPGGVFAALDRNLLATEIENLRSTLRSLRPRVIVALGAEAAHALVPEWPDARRDGRLTHLGDIKRACDIENHRGYVFDTTLGPVVATVHPAFVAKSWTPWRVLLSYDLQRASEVARDGLIRPTRAVEIIGRPLDMRRAVESLRRSRCFACDIETRADLSVACVGFAGSGGASYVFTPQCFDGAKALLGDPGLTAIFANGIYDLFVLKHREGWDIQARVEDVQIAWHAAYAELAGAKDSKRGAHRFTRKSLAFLASMFTFDEWWKATYTNEQEFLEYNGKDCCITRDVWDALAKVRREVGCDATYEHERSLMMPCVDMLARGLRVDEALRVTRISELEARILEVTASANATVLPLLEREWATVEALGVAHLFTEIDGVCPCCRHAKKKQARCWGCAGFERAPTKKQLEELALTQAFTINKGKREDYEVMLLDVCAVCGGAPRKTRRVVNLNSDTQQKIVLYEILKLPKRYAKNAKGESVLVSDEATMKSLLGGLPT